VDEGRGLTWKMECYTWVSDPLPPESWEEGYYVGASLVDAALSRAKGTGCFAEELAGSCGLSMGTVRTRLEELVLEGKVGVAEMEYPREALGPQILSEHFTRALRTLDRANFYVYASREAHVKAHHGGDIGNALDEVSGAFSRDICRDLTAAYGNEAISLENTWGRGDGGGLTFRQ
jgi:hypothetical protein